MARKQKNGFAGKGFNSFGRADRIGKLSAPGRYPADRRYGSSIQRTVIENYDLDSNWAKWRRGFEYYNQAAWLRFQLENSEGELEDAQLISILYQGAVPDDQAIRVLYDGYKFATLSADSGNHYVVKRTVLDSPDLGIVTKVENDQFQYPEAYRRNELRVMGTNANPLLLRMVRDRITDGVTSATLNYVLNGQGHPALYVGKSHPDFPQTVTVTVPTDELLACDVVQAAGGRLRDLQVLVGELGYTEQFFRIRDIDQINSRFYEGSSRLTSNVSASYVDSEEYFGVIADMEVTGESFSILDQSGNLPPSMLEIANLPKLFDTQNADIKIDGVYVYQKQLYQRFFGRQYLTAELVAMEAHSSSFTVMPFTILGIEPQGDTTKIVSLPAVGELELYAYSFLEDNSLVFDSTSFTKFDGTILNTEVNPWDEEVFQTGTPLKPATLYTCSCPSYGKSILRMPETTEDRETRKTNRQRNYPLPTVLGKERFEGLGINNASGIIESWETRAEATRYKICKHTVAAMFIEGIKVKEPSQYPSIETRKVFDEKLKADIDEVLDRFHLSLERSEITTTEIVFGLAQGLNLDDVELAYVMANSKF